MNKFKMSSSAAPPIVMPFRGGLFGFEPAQQYKKKKDSNRLGFQRSLLYLCVQKFCLYVCENYLNECIYVCMYVCIQHNGNVVFLAEQ